MGTTGGTENSPVHDANAHNTATGSMAESAFRTTPTHPHRTPRNITKSLRCLLHLPRSLAAIRVLLDHRTVTLTTSLRDVPRWLCAQFRLQLPLLPISPFIPLQRAPPRSRDAQITPVRVRAEQPPRLGHARRDSDVTTTDTHLLTVPLTKPADSPRQRQLCVFGPFTQ